jgi:hypothetical protein
MWSMRDTSWTAAYRHTDLVPTEEDDDLFPGKGVMTAQGLRRVIGPQHVVTGGTTLCGIREAEVEIMTHLFSLSKDTCRVCARAAVGSSPVSEDDAYPLSAERHDAPMAVPERDLSG